MRFKTVKAVAALATASSLVVAMISGGAAAHAETATETVKATSGTLTWGYKESWRHHMPSPILGKPGVTTAKDGVKETTPGGVFTWKNLSPAVTINKDGANTFTFPGYLQFQKYPSGENWMVDTTFKNLRLRIEKGNKKGVLLADVTSRKDFSMSDAFSGKPMPAPTTEPNLEFATVDLNSATVNYDSAEIAVSNAAVTLTEDRVGGGQYKDQIVDPLSFTLKLEKAKPTANKDDEQDDKQTEKKDDPQTEKKDDPQPEKKKDPQPEKKKDPQPEPQPEPAPAPAAVDECVAKAVESGSFYWGLKESFRKYVQGRIAKGSFEGGNFSVSGGAVNVKDGVGVINLAGSITANGHGGILSFKLVNPSIQLNGGNKGVLYATVNGSRIAFATLTFSGLQISEQRVSADWVNVNLSAAGNRTLSYQGHSWYKNGEQLDGFKLNVGLGATVKCSPGTDPKLAATGADNAAVPAALGAMLVLGSAAALVVARRSKLHV